MSISKITLYIPVIFYFLVCPVNLFGQETQTIPKIPTGAERKFVLTVENDLLSLKAHGASLRGILAEIKHKMGIEVAGEIPAEDTITAEFHHLLLEQALYRLSPNYGYQMKTDEGQQRIARIFVLPKRTEPAGPRPELPVTQTVTSSPTPVLQEPERYPEADVQQEEKSAPERPQSFKFEFDPSASMGK
ncbi:MAG: hypothetical protein MRJ67_00600 [Nitrospirales bacterium]|nr:hypothetical protein [Nitrospira sp.]MDR4459016.1 hypothetical protein [Nitrospirales bacterium]MDR4483610.1 hypothetical protein [Nitrospirales bacterium]